MNAGANKQKIDGQPFPKSGGLFKNSDLRLEQLKQKLEIKNQSRSKAEVYAYILSTVSSGKHESRFLQKGSAPNFQGDHITLCTCKHYMRSSRSVECWRNVWIAGFTSNGEGRNYLICLIQVERAFNSFRELWDAKILSGATKKAKNAPRNSLGDLFRPLRTKPTNHEPARRLQGVHQTGSGPTANSGHFLTVPEGLSNVVAIAAGAEDFCLAITTNKAVADRFANVKP